MAKDEPSFSTYLKSDDNDVNIGVNFTWTTDTPYGYYVAPTLETIDGKIENIKVLIRNLESRISVIEQHMLRMITQLQEILDKVGKNDTKV